MLGEWHVRFPDTEPIAHMLKTAFPSLWVRFHSLPGSKRYPQDRNEYATVLTRLNCILGELVGPESEVVLLTTEYAGDAAPPSARIALGTLDPEAKSWRCIPMHDLDGNFAEPSYWHVFASMWEWRPGVFDPIFRMVADDLVANLMIVDPTCRWILHPYDGGMDVILGSSAARDRLKSLHPEWLSRRADGL